MIGPKQGRGDPTLYCGYTQGRNISGPLSVNIGPYNWQGEKLWYILRVYLASKAALFCCKTFAAS